jgi:hypothetical protein
MLGDSLRFPPRPLAAVVTNAESRPETGEGQFGARSREELFRCLCRIVLVVAPAWGHGGSADIEVTGPLSSADVVGVFAEISEKYHVEGIGLRVVDRDHALHAILAAAARDLGDTRGGWSV